VAVELRAAAHSASVRDPGSAPLPPGGDIQPGDATSFDEVQAFAEGLLSALGHDPVFEVREFSGAVEFAPGSFEAP